MPWHNDKLVSMTYATPHSQNGWAFIDGVGWKKVRTGAADGVTNSFIALNAAKANARPVSVFEDDGDHTLTTVYLK